MVDSSSGALIPFYDKDTNIVFIAGRVRIARISCHRHNILVVDIAAILKWYILNLVLVILVVSISLLCAKKMKKQAELVITWIKQCSINIAHVFMNLVFYCRTMLVHLNFHFRHSYHLSVFFTLSSCQCWYTCVCRVMVMYGIMRLSLNLLTVTISVSSNQDHHKEA